MKGNDSPYKHRDKMAFFPNGLEVHKQQYEGWFKDIRRRKRLRNILEKGEDDLRTGWPRKGLT